MRTLICALALLVSLPATALPPNVEQVETFRGITQYRLKSNGMTILLAPDHASPVFTFMVVYHVGSRNEAPGNTGSAHLLEHMIFNKSTENFGRANGHKTFLEVLHEGGADASSTNMTTWYDRMNGYSTLPSDKLELAMRIEADRLGRALILDEERKPEMSVVRNEFEIGENNPSRALLKATVATAIQAHPYHWNTIGYRSDIEGVSTEKLREHYKTYFHADNAEAILAGDFETEAALALFDRQFGAFARSPQPIPQVITVEPPQEGERRTLVKRPGTVGLVQIGYMRPAATHPDFIALEVLTSILADGVNSRLYQALVDTGIATGVSADNEALRDPYPLLLTATAAPGKPHAEVEAALKTAVADVADKGVTQTELLRAQQQIEVSIVRSRDGPYRFTVAMGEAVASTDWKWFLTYVERINAVTAADVKRVAANYLVPDRATVGWFVPSANVAKPVEAALAPPPPQLTAALQPVSRPAAPQQLQAFAQRTVRKVLSNGLVVDVVSNRSVPTVSVRGLVLAGQMTAPAAQPALADLAGKMLARGTTSRDKEQIGALLDDVGANRSYSTQLTELGIDASGMARDLPLLLEILADELRRPAFAPAELAKARRELENDYLRADDDTSQRAQQRLGQLTFAAGHPYRPASRAEKLRSLAAITDEELRAFHRARYAGNGMILAIVGDVEPGPTIALVEKLFGTLAAGERVSFAALPRTAPLDRGVREAVTLRGKANMNIVMGSASGLRRNDADYEAALVANAALGQNALASRLGRRVRDTEGLTYSINSRFLQSDVLDGVWLVNVNVAPPNLARAIRSTREELEKYAREGATEAEVQAQKSFFSGNYRVSLGSNAGIAAALAVAEKFGFGPRYLDEFPLRIAAVTAEQANAAMRKHFFPERLHLIVAGDLETLPD
ncbi:MAG: peptidase domain protein [Ramlibacter sp.]|nr:peptidase domain protein [Ramlibacter sp.]